MIHRWKPNVYSLGQSGYFTLTGSPELELHLQLKFNVILGGHSTFAGKSYPFCKGYSQHIWSPASMRLAAWECRKYRNAISVTIISAVLISWQCRCVFVGSSVSAVLKSRKYRNAVSMNLLTAPKWQLIKIKFCNSLIASHSNIQAIWKHF